MEVAERELSIDVDMTDGSPRSSSEKEKKEKEERVHTLRPSRDTQLIDY